ncbi:MAG TPA: branched-chain amino acid ABC transporter permease [Candidatus Avacidaminococcus intestinavium]|uniref:Branched-chain amino acid ABC transporter permease n=1 Tax=Candidatus Avacidaminococcus intestinavium TaxID=2840684 RepID=A0A9D1MQN4_9FIRM|nr:branched-chain amino acid ABC transporter permease [Candidatus Avacidaminococcus intestinavium]
MANKRNLLLTIIAIAALFALAWYINFESDSYTRRIVNLCLVYAIIGLSMNLTNGFTGQFSLGQAGFMAIGAYTVGIFTVPVAYREAVFYAAPMNPYIANIELPLWLALLVGGLLAALVAFLIGTPVLRLRGDYLAVATLGFSEIIRIVITNAQTITNGALGIKDIPPLNDVRYIFAVTCIVFIFITALINSSYGRAFKAIREDEIAAEAMGIDLFKHKCMAFMLSAFFAGIGGGLYGALLGTVDPKNFLFTLTYNFLLIIVLGGMGSITGSMLGAILVTAGLEFLRVFDEPLELFGTAIPLFRPGFRMVIFSVLLMMLVLYWRHGIMGTREFSWDKAIAFCKNPFTFFKKKGGQKA